MARNKRAVYDVDEAEILENVKKRSLDTRDYYSSFALTLNKLLSEKEIDQEQMAEDLEISTGSISDYRNGKGNPTLDKIRKIADYLNVDCNYLLTGVKSEHHKISAYTGLSEKAIQHLHHYAREQKPYKEYLEILSEMLSSATFYSVMAFLVRAKRIESKNAEKRKVDPDAYDKMQGIFEYIADAAIMNNNDGNGVHLNLRQSKDFYLLQATKYFEKEAEYLVNGGMVNYGKESK